MELCGENFLISKVRNEILCKLQCILRLFKYSNFLLFFFSFSCEEFNGMMELWLANDSKKSVAFHVSENKNKRKRFWTLDNVLWQQTGVQFRKTKKKRVTKNDQISIVNNLLTPGKIFKILAPIDWKSFYESSPVMTFSLLNY